MLRIWVVYIIALLIALQSVLAIADVHKTHKESEQHLTHLNSEEHLLNQHSHSEFSSQSLLESETNAESSTSSEINHVECHHNHCHHSSVVFIIEHDENNLFALNVELFIHNNFQFKSPTLSPSLRPPIA